MPSEMFLVNLTGCAVGDCLKFKRGVVVFMASDKGGP